VLHELNISKIVTTDRGENAIITLNIAQIKTTNLTRVLDSLSGANHVVGDPLWSVF